MGTNYYTERDKPCVTCGVGGSEWHIGKSSGGWQFLFASYPEQGLTSFAAWKEFLKGRVIKDEYGKVVPAEQLYQWIEDKQGEWNAKTAPQTVWPGNRDGHEFHDPEGYRFSNSSDFC